MLATSAAVYPWIEENIHSKLKGNTGVCSNEDQFTSGLRLWKTTPSSPSSSQDLWKYNKPFIWQEEAWGKQKICFADRMCFLCTCWNSHYTLHKPCTSWQLYFKHKGLKKKRKALLLERWCTCCCFSGNQNLKTTNKQAIHLLIFSPIW